MINILPKEISCVLHWVPQTNERSRWDVVSFDLLVAFYPSVQILYWTAHTDLPMKDKESLAGFPLQFCAKRFISPEMVFRDSSYEVLFLNGSIFPLCSLCHIMSNDISCHFFIFVVKILYFLICLIIELCEKQTCAWKV